MKNEKKMENAMMVTIKSPIKVLNFEKYMLALEDADGVIHFWLKNGQYDGYDKECDVKIHDTSMQMDEDKKYQLYECPECGWEGEGIELTEDGECPKCYALLDEDLCKGAE